MKKNDPAPVTLELIEWLERTFPDRLPREVMSSESLAREIGRQDVIRKLKKEYDNYTTN